MPQAYRTHRSFGWWSFFRTELTGVSGTGMKFLQNSQKCRIVYGCCTEPTEVSGTDIRCCTRGMIIYQITQKFRVRVRKLYRTHRKFRYGCQSPTEPTDVSGAGIARVNTPGGAVLYVTCRAQPWKFPYCHTRYVLAHVIGSIFFRERSSPLLLAVQISK